MMAKTAIVVNLTIVVTLIIFGVTHNFDSFMMGALSYAVLSIITE